MQLSSKAAATRRNSKSGANQLTIAAGWLLAATSSSILLTERDCAAQDNRPRSIEEATAMAKKAKRITANDLPGIHFATDIPTNFPIPSYSSNVVRKIFSTSTTGVASASATIFTKDQPDRVYSWYKDSCKSAGWAILSPNPQGGTKISKSGPLYLIEAKKDRQRATILCRPDKKTGGTTVGIAWSKARK